jgi:hypothetical protein
MLSKSGKGNKCRNNDEASSNADKARSDACHETDDEKGEQGDGVHDEVKNRSSKTR